MFYKGEKMGGDFKGDRTVDALTRFVKQSYATMGFGENGPTGNKKTDAKEAKEWDADSTNYKATRIEKTWNADDHPGCQINGNIWVNRLPGRLQVRHHTHTRTRARASGLKGAMARIARTHTRLWT